MPRIHIAIQILPIYIWNVRRSIAVNLSKHLTRTSELPFQPYTEVGFYEEILNHQRPDNNPHIKKSNLRRKKKSQVNSAIYTFVSYHELNPHDFHTYIKVASRLEMESDESIRLFWISKDFFNLQNQHC